MSQNDRQAVLTRLNIKARTGSVPNVSAISEVNDGQQMGASPLEAMKSGYRSRLQSKVMTVKTMNNVVQGMRPSVPPYWNTQKGSSPSPPFPYSMPNSTSSTPPFYNFSDFPNLGERRSTDLINSEGKLRKFFDSVRHKEIKAHEQSIQQRYQTMVKSDPGSRDRSGNSNHGQRRVTYATLADRKRSTTAPPFFLSDHLPDQEVPVLEFQPVKSGPPNPFPPQARRAASVSNPLNRTNRGQSSTSTLSSVDMLNFRSSIPSPHINVQARHNEHRSAPKPVTTTAKVSAISRYPPAPNNVSDSNSNSNNTRRDPAPSPRAMSPASPKEDRKKSKDNRSEPNESGSRFKPSLGRFFGRKEKIVDESDGEDAEPEIVKKEDHKKSKEHVNHDEMTSPSATRKSNKSEVTLKKPATGAREAEQNAEEHLPILTSSSASKVPRKSVRIEVRQDDERGDGVKSSRISQALNLKLDESDFEPPESPKLDRKPSQAKPRRDGSDEKAEAGGKRKDRSDEAKSPTSPQAVKPHARKAVTVPSNDVNIPMEVPSSPKLKPQARKSVKTSASSTTEQHLNLPPLPKVSYVIPDDPEASIDPQSVQMRACNICSRTFAIDRLKKHEAICSKSTKKKRKKFDESEMRKRGTDLEEFSGNSSSNGSLLDLKGKKSGWREKHGTVIFFSLSGGGFQSLHILTGIEFVSSR